LTVYRLATRSILARLAEWETAGNGLHGIWNRVEERGGERRGAVQPVVGDVDDRAARYRELMRGRRIDAALDGAVPVPAVGWTIIRPAVPS
jgi:hypothetical protein